MAGYAAVQANEAFDDARAGTDHVGRVGRHFVFHARVFGFGVRRRGVHRRRHRLPRGRHLTLILTANALEYVRKGLGCSRAPWWWMGVSTGPGCARI